MLEYLLERLDHCKRLNDVIVATSTDESDNWIEGYCKGVGVICYRGPLLNVAGRFKEVLDAYPFDTFIRICGDSPLLDLGLVENAAKIYFEGDYDIITNTHPKTFPKGQSVEVLNVETFKNVYKFMKESEDLEHVTRYFYRNKNQFRIYNVESEKNQSNIQLSIDTPRDMKVFEAIVTSMTRPHWEYGLKDIISLYFKENHPSKGLDGFNKGT